VIALLGSEGFVFLIVGYGIQLDRG
jgi:hypothetical protein